MSKLNPQLENGSAPRATIVSARTATAQHEDEVQRQRDVDTDAANGGRAGGREATADAPCRDSSTRICVTCSMLRALKPAFYQSMSVASMTRESDAWRGRDAHDGGLDLREPGVDHDLEAEPLERLLVERRLKILRGRG